MPTTLKRLLNPHDMLAWATRHREITGKWPVRTSGAIPGTHGETRAAVDAALRYGTRGLPGGSSLARWLAEKCGTRNIQALSRLTELQILQWAIGHHARTGSCPGRRSGTIPDSGGEN
jgi:hypothetical protein